MRSNEHEKLYINIYLSCCWLIFALILMYVWKSLCASVWFFATIRMYYACRMVQFSWNHWSTRESPGGVVDTAWAQCVLFYIFIPGYKGLSRLQCGRLPSLILFLSLGGRVIFLRWDRSRFPKLELTVSFFFFRQQNLWSGTSLFFPDLKIFWVGIWFFNYMHVTTSIKMFSMFSIFEEI